MSKSKVRAPILSFDQIDALRSLLRIDFARGLKQALEEHNPSVKLSTMETAVIILELTEYMTELEAPLLIHSLFMDMTGEEPAQCPLANDEYGFLAKLLTIPMKTSDFPGVADTEIMPLLTSIQASVEGLKQAFLNAPTVEADVGDRAIEKGEPSKSGLLN